MPFPTNDNELESTIIKMEALRAPENHIRLLVSEYDKRKTPLTPSLPPTPEVKAPSAGLLSNVATGIKEQFTSGAEKFGQGVKDIATGLTTPQAGMQELPKGLTGAAEGMAGATQAALSIPTGIITGAAKTGFEALPQGMQEDWSKTAKENLQRLQQVKVETYDKLPPVAQQAIDASLNALSSLVAGGAAKGVAESAAAKMAGEAGTRATGVISEAAGAGAKSLGKKAVAQSAEVLNKGVTELLTPKLSKTAMEENIVKAAKQGRLSEGGIITPSAIAPDKKLIGAINEVSVIPGLEHSNPVKAVNQIASTQKTVAQNLEKSLSAIPLDIGDMEKAAKQFKGYIKKAAMTDPNMTLPGAEESANRLAKSIANKMERGEIKNVDDLWKLRQFADDAIIKNGSYDSLPPAQKAALDLNRNMINDSIEVWAPGAKAQFIKWSNLQNALELSAPKAREAMNSTVGKIVEKAKSILGLKSSILGTGAAIGLAGSGLLPAAGTATAITAAAALPSYAVYRAGKWVLSSDAKEVVSRALAKLSKLTKSSDPLKVTQAKKDIQYLKSLQPGLSVQAVDEAGNPLTAEARQNVFSKAGNAVKSIPGIDEQAFKIRQNLQKETGKAGDQMVTLYHGTDAKSAASIKDTGKIGRSAEDITFFTKSFKEAKEYARNKSKYRGSLPEVIKVEIPTQVVRRGQQSSAGGFEYEVQGILDYSDGVAKHSNENLVKAFKK